MTSLRRKRCGETRRGQHEARKAKTDCINPESRTVSRCTYRTLLSSSLSKTRCLSSSATNVLVTSISLAVGPLVAMGGVTPRVLVGPPPRAGSTADADEGILLPFETAQSRGCLVFEVGCDQPKDSLRVDQSSVRASASNQSFPASSSPCRTVIVPQSRCESGYRPNLRYALSPASRSAPGSSERRRRYGLKLSRR